MRGKIYILGTNHLLQCGSNKCCADSIQKFRELVRNTIQEFGIELLAEEMSDDGLKNYDVKATIVQELAIELSKSYFAADLSAKEKASFGIDDYSMGIAAAPVGCYCGDDKMRKLLDNKITDRLREYCWFARILARDTWPAFFVCGTNHVQNLVLMMREIGQEVIVIHDNYNS